MPKNSITLNRLLDEKETAELLRVSPKTLQQWRWRKTGPPAVRIGRRACRYRLSDLLAYLETLQVHAGEKAVISKGGDDAAS